MFRDRSDAGRQLAGALSRFAENPSAVVLGIPRGGVVVAAEVARELGLPLDVVIAAKVGAPGFAEFAAGAVAPDGEVAVNPRAGVSAADVRRLAGPVREKVERRLAAFRAGRGPLDLVGRTAIVVDDGLATGLTAIAAVDYLRRQGAERIVLAVPVAAADSVRALEAHADEVVVLDVPPDFMAVGQFYELFSQTEDGEVIELLREYDGAHAQSHQHT